MNVICTIAVISFHFFSTADVKGKILFSNDKSYVVDFSVDAKKRGFAGDYSERIVNKDSCVVEK